MFPYSGAEVHEDYDCMLNQTNIGNNNNKFYIIQVLNVGQYYAWNRWGRVVSITRRIYVYNDAIGRVCSSSCVLYSALTSVSVLFQGPFK